MRSAWGWPQDCPRLGWGLPEVGTRLAWGLPEVGIRSAWGWHEVCTRLAWGWHKVCMRLAWGLPYYPWTPPPCSPKHPLDLNHPVHPYYPGSLPPLYPTHWTPNIPGPHYPLNPLDCHHPLVDPHHPLVDHPRLAQGLPKVDTRSAWGLHEVGQRFDLIPKQNLIGYFPIIPFQMPNFNQSL